MSATKPDRARFLTDRMLGTLARYLRFMGYDTLSANQLSPGDRKEDTRLLEIAGSDGRILLTRDRELAARGAPVAVYVEDEAVIKQVRQLTSLGLVDPVIRMSRCSLCNEPLRRAREAEISEAEYAPVRRPGLQFFWCRRCKKLYWTGSHQRNLEKRMGDEGI
ncbi:MAG: Mut7-C RNAse domain-containing protein [Methanoregulaceae archaeon]|nr:Mut7-C RNAse domain-containing protein [Methanoregulaceae archaeon]